MKMYDNLNNAIDRIGWLKIDNEKASFFIDKNIYNELLKANRKGLVRARSSEETIIQRLSRLK